jgi:dTMP kinase
VSGKFISIEGIEGVGKSTQVDLLHETIVDAGIRCFKTREPGGTPGAERIRELFIRHPWDGVSESFLLMAARRDHVMNVIRPTLEEGYWMLSDRFALTTFAYQGYGRGVDLSLLRRMNRIATLDTEPDLSIILDLPPDLALARARKRSAPDRMERLEAAWFERVRRGFWELAWKNKRTCAVVNATGSVDEVHLAIKSVVRERLMVEFE